MQQIQSGITRDERGGRYIIDKIGLGFLVSSVIGCSQDVHRL
jgi:hypothetical protein